jgi:hypothetical protein
MYFLKKRIRIKIKARVPSRLGSKTTSLLCEKSSFRRKYSEMIRSSRKKLKMINFFINKRRKGCYPGSRSLCIDRTSSGCSLN